MPADAFFEVCMKKEWKAYFRKEEIILWCASVVVCFAAFFVNDIYGFVSWRRMERRKNLAPDNTQETQRV